MNNLELDNSSDDSNSPKESKVSNDDDTFSKSAQNSLPLSTARQIYHWPAHNSINPEFAHFILLIPPIHE